MPLAIAGFTNHALVFNWENSFHLLRTIFFSVKIVRQPASNHFGKAKPVSAHRRGCASELNIHTNKAKNVHASFSNFSNVHYGVGKHASDRSEGGKSETIVCKGSRNYSVHRTILGGNDDDAKTCYAIMVC